jgi:hypothetical protein
MVIGGEKTPAFSARTLNLPIAQADNTAAIIENTRRTYSRPRAEVEKMISDLVNSANSAPIAVQPPKPNVTTWPINAQSQVITPDKPQQDSQPANSDGAAKKKRTRSRKRKPSTSQDQTASSRADEPARHSTKPTVAEGTLPEKGTAEIQLR